MKKIKKKDIIVILLSVFLSIISGIITKDLIVGGAMLLTSLLCSYFAIEGKKISYIIGFINYLLTGYVSFKNNLFGLFLFYIFIFAPLQIRGFISWRNNEDKDNTVRVRKFTLKNSIIVISLCIIGSLLLGYLLTLIQNQNLAFMDATSNCINLCGVILMLLRFKEAWWVWLVNNIIDLVIWTIMALNNGNGAIMGLLSSVAFLLGNIYGIIKWGVKAKKEEK